MKRKYKIVIGFIVVEFLCVSLLKSRNVHIEGWLMNALGTLIFFSPIEYLLFSISKDTAFSKNKRIIAKVFFYYIIICYIIAGVVTFFTK